MLTFAELYNQARLAGSIAGRDYKPTPMVIQQRANQLDDSSPVVYQETIADGVCGFAWIVIKPGNSAFANWLKKNDMAKPAYEGGVSVYVHEFNQSMEKKEVYARAFAKVLTDAGIRAYAMSRMD